VEAHNPTDRIAFFLEFMLVDASTDEPLLPVYWSDNYISLLPGETRSYDATYYLADIKADKPVLKVNAWNVKMVTLN
jgi:exo-1,4-beta-D-glucosaminidase